MKSINFFFGPILVFSLLGLQPAEAGKKGWGPTIRARKLHVLRKALPKAAGYRDASVEQTYAVKSALKGMGISHPAGVPITRDAKGRTYHHESSAMLGHIRRLGVLVGRENLSAKGEPSAFPVQLFVRRKGGVTKADHSSPATIKLDSRFRETELGPGIHMAKLVEDKKATGGWRLEKLKIWEYHDFSRQLNPDASRVSRVKELHELK